LLAFGSFSLASHHSSSDKTMSSTSSLPFGLEVNADDLMEEARVEAALLLQATDLFTFEVDGSGRART
jgi:hypothetical protein